MNMLEQSEYRVIAEWHTARLAYADTFELAYRPKDFCRRVRLRYSSWVEFKTIYLAYENHKHIAMARMMVSVTSQCTRQ